jgi:hypothetical protein
LISAGAVEGGLHVQAGATAMATRKPPAQVHRSRQKIEFSRREHLHDGLRMMVADVPREHGWLIQRPTTNVLIEEADACESELYVGARAPSASRARAAARKDLRCSPACARIAAMLTRAHGRRLTVVGSRSARSRPPQGPAAQKTPG